LIPPEADDCRRPRSGDAPEGAGPGPRAAERDPGRPVMTGHQEPEALRYGSDGLVAAIVQDVSSKDVLMLAWMDAEALKRTMESGRTWFWSRSRQEYWCKGETSGNRQHVCEVRYDCDGDALLVLVEQEGRGACHTGEWTCFHRVLGR
jgi:phosphoribosyl-AMP cyclohydrolase